MNWIKLTKKTLPPYNELVWVERYTIGTAGVHHEIYLGARSDAPLSEDKDPSRNCYWFGRRLDDLYCEKGDGLSLTHEWSDTTVKRWAAIESPELPSNE